jgi:hypothetical protein
LLTLINNKWPLGIDPGGHHFIVLNVSINKKPVFLSYVVHSSKTATKDRTLMAIVLSS